MTDGRKCLALLGVALTITACGRFSAPSGAAGGGPGVIGDQGGAGHPSIGLVSIVPGEDRARVEWRFELAEGAPPPALFLHVAEDPAVLFDTPGTALVLEDGWTLVEGLTTDTPYWFGLSLDEGQGALPTGPILSARTSAPIYVDPSAPPGGDGSLAAPFNDLFPGILIAFVHGGGNVWSAEGTFEGASYGLLEGADLYGGFAADFALETRDPSQHETRLSGIGSNTLIALDASSVPAVIDGFTLEGSGASAAGVDCDTHPVELRRLTISGCSRAMKLRSVPPTETAIQIVRCTLGGSGVEGLSIDGAFHLTIEDCAFVANGQEGIDASDLIAPPGGKASLFVRDSRFADNVADGLDIDMAAPFTTGPGGKFKLVIEDCEFERNGGVGLLLDHDFETTPEWFARITVRGCRSRANAEAGMHFDLDGPGVTRIHRCRVDANGGDGLLISSEIHAGTMIAADCAFAGNQGFGVRGVEGQAGILLSHCVLQGNRLGGLEGGPGGALAVSSVAYLQPSPWIGGEHYASVQTNSAQTFARAATAYHKVTAIELGELVLSPPPTFGSGATLEVVEDDVARTALTVGADRVQVAPTIEPALPAILSAFAEPGPVQEDWTTPAGSPAQGGGMPPPSGPAPDAGPAGAPLGGSPGREELSPPPLFTFSGSSPSWNQAIAPAATLLLTFEGGDPDPSSLALGLDALDPAGVPLPIDPVVTSEGIELPAPPGGWQSGDLVRLHAALTSDAGDPLASPIALRLSVP